MTLLHHGHIPSLRVYKTHKSELLQSHWCVSGLEGFFSCDVTKIPTHLRGGGREQMNKRIKMMSTINLCNEKMDLSLIFSFRPFL